MADENPLYAAEMRPLGSMSRVLHQHALAVHDDDSLLRVAVTVTAHVMARMIRDGHALPDDMAAFIDRVCEVLRRSTRQLVRLQDEAHDPT